ncbi:MAG: ferritin-like domain-containing protein [Rhabdochlamydiaceae bacterium]
MHPHEVKLTRQYAINEIAGGLLLGHFALKSDNPFIRSQLTYHAMDELRHGWLWTEFLDKKGIGVAGAKGGNDYFNFIGLQTDEIDFLAAVHIYELRVPFHLGTHMEIPEIDPGLKEVMGNIRDDEKFHLSWIREYLHEKMDTDAQHVLDAIRKAEEVEQETYSKYISYIKQFGGYFGELATLVERNMPEFPAPSSYFGGVAQNA